MPKLTRDDLIKLSRTLDRNHPDYDDIRASLLFAGQDPNKVLSEIKSAYRAGAVSDTKVYDSWMSEWEARGSKSGE